MTTAEKLKAILTIDHNILVSSYYKSELIMLDDDQFEQLRKHMNISDYEMHESNSDTIIIGSTILKKQELCV